MKAKTSADKAIDAAVEATRAAVASGNPGAIATAKATEDSVKAAASTAMSIQMASTASQLAAAASSPPDVHTCPILLPVPPHGPGMVLAGSTSVFIGGFAAARANDQITEAVGPPNTITVGELSVQIG
jgi:hypothetical protein